MILKKNNGLRVQYIFIEIQEKYAIIQWLYTYYLIKNEKLDNNNKVFIHQYCYISAQYLSHLIVFGKIIPVVDVILTHERP